MPSLKQPPRTSPNDPKPLPFTFMLAVIALTGSLLFPGQALADGNANKQLCGLFAAKMGGADKTRYFSTTGDKILDGQLAAEGNRLSREFKVRPGLKIIQGNNAFAKGKTVVTGTRGTVALGRELLFGELDKNRRGWGGLVIAGIMAHEFAHIYQFFNGYRDRLLKGSNTVEPLELHADFLAGYHLGLKRREGSKMDIGAFMDGAYMIGDKNTHQYQHHGTPEERRRAVREGYRMGIQGVQVGVAAEKGVKVVGQIMKLRF